MENSFFNVSFNSQTINIQTAKELTGLETSELKKIDKNSDGYISEDELEVYFCDKEFDETLIDIAASYIGKLKESDKSYLEVTDNREESWCADFVSFVVNKTAECLGTDTKGFGSPAVSELRNWGIENDCYTQTSDMTSKQRAEWINENVKAGDVMIMKSENRSHTGIVVKVNDDGSFETIEGNSHTDKNSDDGVNRFTYSPDEADLTGFISMNFYDM